jgi:flagellin-like hook-associated protein FlgL
MFLNSIIGVFIVSDKNPTNTKSEQHAAKVTPIANSRSGELGDANSMERLASTFENSARRWEMIVYPSLFAFIVLACYGFFLIYSLTHDVSSLARDVSKLTQSIDRMVGNMDSITGDMGTISSNMESITSSTQSMAVSADLMRYQMGAMNYNIGRPMSQMSSFMPW